MNQVSEIQGSVIQPGDLGGFLESPQAFHELLVNIQVPLMEF